METSGDERWRRPCGTTRGANTIRSIIQRFIAGLGHGGGRDRRLELDGHGMRAAYVHDVSLGLAYGLDQNPGDPEALHFKWAEKFSNHSVHGMWVDAFWNGMLVYRQRILGVDGGRAYLPAGEPVFIPTDAGATTGETVDDRVTEREVAIARLVHSFSYRIDEFETCLRIAGFYVGPD